MLLCPLVQFVVTPLQHLFPCKIIFALIIYTCIDCTMHNVQHARTTVTMDLHCHVCNISQNIAALPLFTLKSSLLSSFTHASHISTTNTCATVSQSALSCPLVKFIATVVLALMIYPCTAAFIDKHKRHSRDIFYYILSLIHMY